MSEFSTAEELIHQFKGDAYLHGAGILEKVGELAKPLGARAMLISDGFAGATERIKRIVVSLERKDVQIVKQVPGAKPNAPRDDVTRMAGEITAVHPDLLMSFGGGSTTDAVKAANVLACLGGTLDMYFGTGLVTEAAQAKGISLLPHLAIQTAASSGAHLTKYANITDVSTGQKKLMVDEEIVPPRAAFDYEMTLGAPASLTADGALDGVSHALEVLYSAVDKPAFGRILPVSLEAIRLVINFLPAALSNPQDVKARQALGLATDLGGYAIMLGGTNGAHLTSFSLVDILSHGRACGLLNPYYTVFFAPAVEQSLRQVIEIYHEAGYTQADPAKLAGRALGIAAARAMIAFQEKIGFPTTLEEVPGFSDRHIERALVAAKDPQLKMKLENMPVPMTVEMVDDYMRPILLAAKTGDLDLIRNVG